jgi:sugar lactone lactonase YvrE
VDGDGNVLIADADNHRVRCLDMTTNSVTTLAGTGDLGFQGRACRQGTPRGVSIDRDGNVLVSDTFNHRIRCIHMATRHVTTLAGTGDKGFLDGPAASSRFSHPSGVVVTTDGNVLVGDSGNHRIRCLNMATNDVTTLAGTDAKGFQDGPAGTAQLNWPIGLAVDGNGSVLVADHGGHRIRFLDMTTLAGTGDYGFQDGSADRAQFKSPMGIAVDGNGNVLVADPSNHRIRLISNAPNVAPLPLGGSIGFARAHPAAHSTTGSHHTARGSPAPRLSAPDCRRIVRPKPSVPMPSVRVCEHSLTLSALCCRRGLKMTWPACKRARRNRHCTRRSGGGL